MNVSCPNCATVYRVDPTKVPDGGVRARCSVCSAVFAVGRGVSAVGREPDSRGAPHAAATAPGHASPAPGGPGHAGSPTHTSGTRPGGPSGATSRGVEATPSATGSSGGETAAGTTPPGP